MHKPIHIDRPPRLQPDLPFDEVDIPNPPQLEQEGRSRLIQIGLPLVTIIGYVLVATLGGSGRNLSMMIPMALAVVASTAFSIYSYIKERREQTEVERAYAERLVELYRDMKQAHDQQRRFYTYNYPDIQSCVRIVSQSKALAMQQDDRVLRAESRVWERRTADEDFGVVRLGSGTRPSTVIYKLGDTEEFNSQHTRSALKLADDSRFVDEVPITLDLYKLPEREEQSSAALTQPLTPATHALAIAGASAAAYDFVRSILGHFVIFHAPGDARLYVLGTDKEEWGWTQQLPHCQEGEHGSCLLFVDDTLATADRDDDEGDELDVYLESLRRVLVQRKIRLSEKDAAEDQGNPTLPFCLVVVDLLAVYTKQGAVYARLREIETDAALAILVAEGAALGVSVIFLVPERAKAPAGCQAVIEVEKTAPATNSKTGVNAQLHFRYAEIGLNSFRYIGVADTLADRRQLLALASDLSQMLVRQGPGANVPANASYMDLVGYTSLDDLRDDAWKRWKETREKEHANWLRAPLGVMSGNKRRTLVFSAKRDGVHGMVAGSTGSGKSELLIALITGMAVNYDPGTLNFVLVDYKGGGAFKEFEELPHCVDIITNLAADGVTRMFTAIQAEMQRRQALNATTGTKNIVEYRQKNFHQTYQPYPFLFIIIDEFAEMIADRAEYKAQLDSITRVGRAQGVSLILAAQRPSGVTDQMRSNIKFRICLRVETPGESREMLRRVDAAFLPTGVPGRGYLQVGNEEVELIQVAYTGEPYIDPQRAPTIPVIWPDRGGSYDPAQDAPPELYKVIIKTLHELSLKQHLPPQRAPWPNFLPTQLALSEPLLTNDSSVKAITAERYMAAADIQRITMGQPREATLSLSPALNMWLRGNPGWVEAKAIVPEHWAEYWANYALRPVIGLLDNPYAACQLPLLIDLPRGHTVIYGASGWGKSTLLRSLAISLAASHSPDCLHLYLLDLGGRGLGSVRSFPHVGALISPDEEAFEERVEQLLRELDELITQRKTILSNAGSSDLYAYNQAHPDNPQPAIVVLLDNFAVFQTTFGERADEVDSVLARFIVVARQGKAYGVHLVITATQPADLSSAIASLFTERLTLRLADSSDYRTIVGGAVDEIGPVPGRGYMRVSGQPLAFQVALPIDLRREGTNELANENRELELLSRLMHEHIEQSAHTYRKPKRVDALPRAVLLKQLLARENGLDVNHNFLSRLRDLTRQRWVDSRNPKKLNNNDPNNTNWLMATIGVLSGDRPRKLKLEAKLDGVHGLIAGGTGSGKSELLMTLIVSLALNYAPDILNFVLVDYKGGGAFKPFENLPHVVDSVTNLNKNAVKRVFTAIRAEMERRQSLNTATGTKEIVEYRERRFHLTHEPYPHLFIIIDEYAEMIKDNPEFAEELDSITRLGRAQGVNLLLASQRPTGISDQMRANIKLRICLRVEQIDTSREMLRRPDAALLPSNMPGRGYVQVGNDGIELIQVAYTGEPFADAPPDADGKPQTFYAAMVQLAQELLGKTPRPLAPWPPALPTALTFATPLLQEKLDPTSLPVLALGTPVAPTSLSPLMAAWLAGNGQWPGVDWATTALRGVAGLIDNPYAARQLPLVVDLARGHGILFGAPGWGKTTFLRALALGLTASHSPAELHIHALDLGGRNLDILRELPHVGTLISPDERGYEERVQQLWRELNELIEQRKKIFSSVGTSTLMEYNRSGALPILPAQVVLIDNLAELISTFGQAAAQKRDDSDNPLEAFIALARQGRAYGIHFMITAARPNQIASKLYSLFTERFTLRLADVGEYSAVVGSGINEVDEINGRGLTKVGRLALAFQVALPPGAFDSAGRVAGEAQRIRELGAQMRQAVAAAPERYPAPIRVDALPKSVSYREMLARTFAISADPQGFAAALSTAIAQRWAVNRLAANADWLRVPLSIGSGNRYRTLYLKATADGVHGLVAGGTGSGKSELLMTLIIGLATNYGPDLLNFVLVDYKGGGTFKPFAGMPHVVDVVTNLNKAAVQRMFIAINEEMQRRQRLNVATNTKDIIDYREKGLHLSGEPYPHLFIIIDEYAEMISDNPDYRIQLESITRLGRAQGINLVLASQRPKGVSDQMRDNMKLRLCLRVEQSDTSRELLRRPDAAFLPSGMPGRGYMQIGNEGLELIQVAYTGEDLPQLAAADGPTAEPIKLYDMIAQLTRELNGNQPVPRPWPHFLPATLSLETALNDGKSPGTFQLNPSVAIWQARNLVQLWPGVAWRTRDSAAQPIQPAATEAMQTPIGLLDEPDMARQTALTLDVSRNHVAVFGAAGSGKTNLLRSLLVSLAATHSPAELHAYVLDLGSRAFRSLEQLPHVGAVIYADEERFAERLQRLLELLLRKVEERQRTISDSGAGNFYEYNQQHPEQPLPAILLLIDNMAELQENHEALIENNLIPLARRALGNGLSMVVAANIPANIPSRLYNLFAERITFRQTNPDLYMDIVGRGAVEIGDQPGRGYARLRQQPLLFQAALPIGVAQPGERAQTNEASALAEMALAMRELTAARGLHPLPEPINVLPEQLSLHKILADAKPASAMAIEIVLGWGAQLQPVGLDLQRIAPHVAIIGPPLAGKTTALLSWVLALTSRYSPEQVRVILVDMQRKLFDYGGKRRLNELPHVVATISEQEQLAELVANLEQEAKQLALGTASQQLFVVVDNFDDFNDDLSSQQQQRLALVAKRHGRDGLHFIMATTPEAGANASELRRRILAANLGIGLRTAQAVESLKVLRTPPEVRARELPPGRGYLVRSTIPALLQIASPYEVPETQADNNADVEPAMRNANALDWWVAQICAAYPVIHQSWPGGAANSTKQMATTTDPQMQQRRELLQKGAQRELAAFRAGKLNGHSERPLLVELLLQLNGQEEASALRSMLYEMFLREQEAAGKPRSLISMLVPADDEASIISTIEQFQRVEYGQDPAKEQ